MRIVSRINAEDIFTEDILVSDDEPTPGDCVDSRPPEGFYAPKWNGSGWVEGKPASDIFAEAKAQKEAELRDAADAWYRGNVRAFEGAVVSAKWAKGPALNAEEQAVFNEMSSNYTRLKNLINQVRAATTLEELESISWTA